MASLARVLDQAAQQRATEVILDASGAPEGKGPQGSFALGQPLGERELFDALQEVLEPDQLAELAVGQVVEFHLESTAGRWTVRAEPSADGVIVRGCLQGMVERGAPMDLPPLEPFAPGAELDEVGASAGLPLSGDEGYSATEPDPDWLVRNEEGREVATAEPTGVPPEVEEPDELPELITPAFAGGAQPEETTAAATAALPRAAAAGGTATTASSLVDVRGLEGYGGSIPRGTLCLIRGVGAADGLATQFEHGTYTVIDAEDEPGPALRRAATQDPGGTYVVRLEDPSRCLPWILRRLEEGARVLVETRARTLEGARRTLLGADHGPGAEAWLDAHPLVWVFSHNGRWSLEAR